MARRPGVIRDSTLFHTRTHTLAPRRWEQFLKEVATAWDDFDPSAFETEIQEWEAEWTARRGEDLATTPNGQGLVVAQAVYDLLSSGGAAY